MGINRIENPCIESGCAGACCYNVTMANVSAEQLETLAPDGTNLVYIPPENFPIFVRRTAVQIKRLGAANVPPTIYAAPEPHQSTYSVLIAGPCPNLQSDSSCGVYDRRPPQCDLFVFAGDGCSVARKSHGLQPIIATTIRRRVA